MLFSNNNIKNFFIFQIFFLMGFFFLFILKIGADFLSLVKLYDILVPILICLVVFVCILIFVAFFTLHERKLMAFMQRRVGPNKIGFGFGQPFADAVKLLTKEFIFPKDAHLGFFMFSSILSFFLSLFIWILIPKNAWGGLTNPEMGLLIILSVSSLGVYGIIFAGWSSNSKYAFMGSLRSSAQMISYEVVMSFIFMPAILLQETLNIFDFAILQKNFFLFYYLLPINIFFLITGLAETNRAPFDLPEAEAELVAGYNVEYSSMLFALFFLAEYANMGAISGIFINIYMGGFYLTPFSFTDFYDKRYYLNFENLNFQFLNNFSLVDLVFSTFIFSVKVVILCSLFIWVRATFPRYRFDQLMSLCWKVLMPLLFVYLVYFLIIFFYSYTSYFI